MRVALVCPYSLSAPGGVQGQVLALGRALAGLDHEVVVLAPLDGHLSDQGVEVVALGRSVPIPANGSIARLSLDPRSVGRVRRALDARRADVLHLHEPLAPGPTWWCLRRPEPVVGTFHRAGPVRGLRILAPLARLAAKGLTRCTAVSVEARRTAQSLVGSAPHREGARGTGVGSSEGGGFEIVGNGVEIDRFAHAESWPTQGPTILFVGRHEQRKGLAQLLDAFSTLDGPPGARLWVAGSGPETEALRARTSSDQRIEWLGQVSDDDLARRMRGAHVLCAPSRFGESFGVVLVEAMAARTVVVASSIPGYAAVLGDHGALVAPGDVDALRARLGEVLADAASGRGRSAPVALERASRWASQWAMPVIAQRYVEVYERAMAAKEFHRG